MKRIKKFTHLLLLTALLLALVTLPSGAAKVIDSGLTVIFSANSTGYFPGDSAELTLSVVNRSEKTAQVRAEFFLCDGMTPVEGESMTGEGSIAPGETQVFRVAASVYGQTQMNQDDSSKIILITALVVTGLLIVVMVIRYRKAKASVGAILLCALCLGHALQLYAAETTSLTLEETIYISNDDRLISARLDVEFLD